MLQRVIILPTSRATLIIILILLQDYAVHAEDIGEGF
jgi:hypothetical protein